MRRTGPILIVDDDPNDRVMIETALRAAGTDWPITALSGGAAAIDYLKGTGNYVDRQRHPYPAFVITDLKMTPVDGLDILEYLRSTPRAGIIPTVVFSSSADPDDVDKAYALGASSYHVKACDAEGFHAQLKLLLDYWMSCEVPEVSETGMRVPTNSQGRIGERYSTDPFPGSTQSAPDSAT